MTVAFIGSDNFKWTASTTWQFKNKITKLVERDGARTFLFTSNGNFDLLCWVIVTKLRRNYPDIQRIYARINSEEDDPFDTVNLFYEHTFLLDEVCNAGKLAKSVRNKSMVKMCDVLVTYFVTKNVRAQKINGYTEEAVEYAHEIQKSVINLY